MATCGGCGKPCTGADTRVLKCSQRHPVFLHHKCWEAQQSSAKSATKSKKTKKKKKGKSNRDEKEALTCPACNVSLDPPFSLQCSARSMGHHLPWRRRRFRAAVSVSSGVDVNRIQACANQAWMSVSSNVQS